MEEVRILRAYRAYDRFKVSDEMMVSLHFAMGVSIMYSLLLFEEVDKLFLVAVIITLWLFTGFQLWIRYYLKKGESKMRMALKRYAANTQPPAYRDPDRT
jgi:hypothetical protein